ncbi:AAA family ATPase [Yersinia intermedia]|uniref:AAA family ATPase n=1 Tax=Yersinia intermedia TaxID=631 RepID=UPI000B670E5F|nr:AAA family ATPase [Yersinia intermedia]MCW8112958.1 AAA family ATPase [Yersinia intermedia]MDA5517873.1 AAA family ATPase [Yersinia intermedia]OWF90999.1 chromosome segregation protein SMC [Yersinia intermedia]
MKNWKLSKLRINNFKAFDKVEFDFESSSLLTLEGPNGYGKTSVYDALELLFTGKIKRIEQLCETIMPGGVRNYSDNLFWNKKNGEEDIEISVEMSNDNNEKIYFSCRAFANDLKITQNNKADNFSIFKLYKSDSLDSYENSTLITQNELDEILGEKFTENYNFLNYLEQGQSSFIFANSIRQRKNAISGLMNVSELTENISLCGRVQNALTRKITGLNFIEKRDSITSQIQAINEPGTNDNNPVLYEKISTHLATPSWDVENPSFFSDIETTKINESKISLIKNLITNKEQLRIIIDNARIENFITRNENLLAEVIKVGHHIESYPELTQKNKTNNGVNLSLGILRKKEDSITQEDIDKIKSHVKLDIIDFKKRLQLRDNYRNAIGKKNIILVNINQSRKKLTEEHQKATSLSEKNCLLCGHDWITKDLLLAAIDIKTKSLESSLDDIGKLLQTELNELNKSKDAEIQRLVETQAQLKFDKELFDSLQKSESIFEKINKVNERLLQIGISYPQTFTDTPEEIELRKQSLISLIRQQKKNELITLPEDWESVLNESFATPDDVFNIDLEQINRKEKYFLYKKSEANNLRLKALKKELKDLLDLNKAITNAKQKITTLKEQLTILNRDYSKKTISDIELTFHIYSGRLIQNYQRGLGLFIDEGNGDRLRFCTAEKSEHDATMSMSSGQLSALSLAFFLSLNKVYAKSPLVLIDDPAQSLDEINIASLSDLLRCELRNRQLILSSHEDNISSYLRFRFMRAGLSQKPFNMQSHTGR